MKKLLILILIIFYSSFYNMLFANNIKNNMKIKLSFNNKEVVILIYDNEVSKQFLEFLPASFKFTDFANQEKITDLPKSLNLKNADNGMIAKAGKMFIYAPWGNMGIFYKDVSNKLDKNLIPLGEVVSGLEFLSSQKNDFEAKIEIM